MIQMQIGIAEILQGILLALKLSHAVEWSWWLILLPFILLYALKIAIILLDWMCEGDKKKGDCRY